MNHQENNNIQNTSNQAEITFTKQERIAEAVKLFNLLYEKITARHFAYTIKFKDGTRIYSYVIADETQRLAMAEKAIELSDSGVNIWHSVNPVSVEPSGGKRGDENVVSYQTALVVDIDIRSEAHKGDPSKLAANFDEAKSFLPFPPSIIVDSGYGLHAYYIFKEPIAITDLNREEIKRRNELLLDVIRARANGKTIDAVGDLPRILRTPGTFNYKLGADNAPLCHIIEVNDVRFTPEELDEKLNALPTLPKKEATEKATRSATDSLIDSKDFDDYRVRRMLDFINPASLPYDEWFKVGAALKNIGMNYSDWEQWSRADDRFKEGECKYKWDTFDKEGNGIGTLYHFAEQGGYDAKEIYREYADLHPDWAKKNVATRGDDETTEDGEPTTKYYVKDCPVALKLPTNFEFNNYGITQIIPPKKETDEPKRLIATRTPIVPTRLLREAKRDTVQYELEIKSGKKWRRVVVEGRTINDARAILDLANHGALVENPAALKSFFNAVIAFNSDNGRLPTVKLYKMPGWHDGKFIYPQSSGEYIVARDGIDYDALFSVRGSKDAWKEKFEEVCWGKGAIAINGYSSLLIKFIFASALLAPALEVLGIPNTQVHIWGSRNFAKSPILKLAVSIYGNPTEGKLFRNFASTAKNRMTYAAGLCDLPLAIDELEAADKFDDLQGDIYKYFGGTINQANKRDGRAREAEDFRGVRLMTGEHALIEIDTAKGGALKRLIQIQAKSPLMKEDKAHELHLFLADNFGHYGREWVTYISEHRDAMKKVFAILKDKLANDKDAPNCEATHGRAVLGAFFCFALFCVMLKTHSDIDYEWILTRTRGILRELPTLDDIDVAKRAIAYLSSYVAEHPRKFLPDSATYESEDERKRKSEELDGIRYFDGKVAFFPNAFKRIISKSGLPSYSAVLAELYEADCLVARHTREKATQIWQNGKNLRVYLFKAGLLESGDEENETSSAEN